MPIQPNARRRFLQSSLPAGMVSVAVAAGLLKPSLAYAWLPFFNFKQPAPPASPPFASPATLPATSSAARQRTPVEALVEALRDARPETSPAVDLMSPEIAVDGASIMLQFQALLPDVDGLAVYIEGNPKPLAAAFYLTPDVLPEMKLLVRLAQSSNISVVARSQGRFYRNSKFVKVTQGGCSDSFAETESRHRKDMQQRYRPAP